MPGLRSVFAALLLSAALPAAVADAAGAAGVLELVSHDENSVIAGATEFRFEVAEHDPAVERVDVYVQGRLIGAARPPDWTVHWNAPVDLGRAEVLAVGYAAAQIVDKLRLETLDVGFADEINVSAVQLYPVVRNWRGAYVNTLAQEDFTVHESGRAVPIEYFATEASTLTLFLVLDASGSMENDLSIVKDSALRLIDQLRDEDLVALYSFNHAISVLHAAAADHQLAKESLFSLRAGGGTALYDAVIRVLKDTESHAGRKAVVLFSDGMDERSLTSLGRTIETARRSEVLIYTIGTKRTAGDEKARHDLKQLAEETGGEIFLIEKFKQLPEIFDAILSDLRAQYILSFTPREGPPGWRDVEVEVARRGLRVRCRKSYYHDP